MSGQMCWLPTSNSNGEKILHLRLEQHQPWRSYQAFSLFAVPDYPIPGGSKGWATHQKLLKAGWVLVPNKQYDFAC
jgi:hypothetical protein